MISESTLPYGFGATFAMAVEHALERVRSALDRPDQTAVMMLDPQAALSLAGNPAIAGLASEVTSRLQRVLVALDTRR
jgi:hypothetical protein